MKQNKLIKILLVAAGVIALILIIGIIAKPKTPVKTGPQIGDITPVQKQNIEVEGTIKEAANSETSAFFVNVIETDKGIYKLDNSFPSTSLKLKVLLRGYIYRNEYVAEYEKFIPVLHTESAELLEGPPGYELKINPEIFNIGEKENGRP